MKFRATLLALALAGCGQMGAEKGESGEPQPADPWALHLEAGRYGVMLSQIENLTADRPGPSGASSGEPAMIARQLREVVWRYNADRSDLCGRGLFTDVTCGPAYAPIWLSEPESAAPTLDELQTRSTAVGEEVMRFWTAVCDDARSRETDEEAREYVCAIE